MAPQDTGISLQAVDDLSQQGEEFLILQLLGSSLPHSLCSGELAPRPCPRGPAMPQQIRPSTGNNEMPSAQRIFVLSDLSLRKTLLIGIAASLFILANGRLAGISGLMASLLQRTGDGLGGKAQFLLGVYCLRPCYG
jgi:hypothetical protein